MAEEPNKADPPPTHDLYSLNHTGRNLLQPVYSRKSAEHRTRINQYLRIRPVQTIDTDLLETTILAVCFYTDTGLEVQPLRQS